MDSLKRVRERLGLSLGDVAERTGLFPQALWRAEQPGISPRANTLATIAKALGVPVCELFEETGHERQRRKRPAKR